MIEHEATAVMVPMEPDRWLFHCPGCGCAHQIDGRWAFNGDVHRPTIGGSVLVHAVEGIDRPRCHSFVIDGQIQFCADSTHALAGKTVDLPPWDVS